MTPPSNKFSVVTRNASQGTVAGFFLIRPKLSVQSSLSDMVQSVLHENSP